MYSSDKCWLTFTPLGAADQVTGSCGLITVKLGDKEKNYLVDCGMFTERDSSNLDTNIVEIISKVDAIFVTHAHVDHTGRLPYAYKLGYRGPIYATAPVTALSHIMLRDSANIKEQECMQVLRKAKLKNDKFLDDVNFEPLYTVYDAEQVVEQFVSVKKNKQIKVDDYLTVCFYNAGHGLGSASIMLTFNNGLETYRMYFSGDIGQNNPILKYRRDSYKEDVDLVVMETTYAGRFHPKRNESWNDFRELVGRTLSNGGNVIIPAFAVGRTQEILYLYYKDMMENDDWIARLLRNTPVYIDSNMAVAATQEFTLFEEELKEPVRRLITDEKHGPFNFPQLTMIADAEASKQLTMKKSNYVVIAAAGMCNAGRVLYHLEKDLENPKSTVIFTGYQAECTLGRIILDGAKQVQIHGKPVNVKATIASITAVSGHTDQPGLVKWLSNIEPGYTLFLGHGVPEAQREFKNYLADSGVIQRNDVEVMKLGRRYHLYKGGYDVEKLKPTSVSISIDTNCTFARDKTEQVNRIRNFLRHTPVTCLEPETLAFISVLDSHLKQELKKVKKASKRQSKPNRAQVGKFRK